MTWLYNIEQDSVEGELHATERRHDGSRITLHEPDQATGEMVVTAFTKDEERTAFEGFSLRLFLLLLHRMGWRFVTPNGDQWHPDNAVAPMPTPQLDAVALTELARIDAAAWPAPWHRCGENREGCPCGFVHAESVAGSDPPFVARVYADEDLPSLNETQRKSATAAIVAFRNAAPKLIAQARAYLDLRAELSALRSASEYWVRRVEEVKIECARLAEAKLADALRAGPDVVYCEEDRGPAGNVCLGCGSTLEKPHTWADCHTELRNQEDTWLEAWLNQAPEPSAAATTLRKERAARKQAENERALARLEASGAGSLLLDVQQDCIAATKRADTAEQHRDLLTSTVRHIHRATKRLALSLAKVESKVAGDGIEAVQNLIDAVDGWIASIRNQTLPRRTRVDVEAAPEGTVCTHCKALATHTSCEGPVCVLDRCRCSKPLRKEPV